MKKKELGQGIRALINPGVTEAPEEKEQLVRELSNTVTHLPVEQIQINPYQPRTDFDEEALEELANSIRIHGLIQPITVRHLSDGKFQIISGERRFRASQLVGLKELPAYIRIANDQEMLEMAIIENVQREDLNAMEISISYQRLIDECQLTHDNLAERVGKKRSTVTNYLRLLRLPPAAQQAIKEQQISMGHARALSGVEDLSTQLTLLDRAIQYNWSVRRLEDEARNFGQQKAKIQSKTASASSAHDPNVTRLQDELSATFGSKVVLQVNKQGNGKLSISFKNLDELQEIMELVRSIPEA